MHKTAICMASVALALASLACTITVPFPTTEIKTGPTQTKDIHIPAPAEAKSVTFVTLRFGAGQLNVAGGAIGSLVDGTASYNVTDFEPKITTSGSDVRIDQGNLEMHGIPNFNADQIKNQWDLKLGVTPINLRVNAGAYNGQYELGGLAITDLYVTDGASNVSLGFSQPNATDMASLRYETGASNVTLTGLGNANFSTMSFRAGAGNYTLDFSGSLRRDASVRIESGLSSVTIRVPQGTAARVTFEGGLSNIQPSGDWQRNGDAFVRAGSGPSLTIVVSMAAGDVRLQTE
jgi:hypothetical protein